MTNPLQIDGRSLTLEDVERVATSPATVELDRGAMVVRSGYCGDDKMMETLREHLAELRAAGIARVTCAERHGAEVFTLETHSGAGADE